MTGARRGLWLACAALLVGGAIIPPTLLLHGARRAAVRETRETTYLVSRLWREPGGPTAARAALPGRVRAVAAPEPGLDGVTVGREGGALAGRAPVYDRDDWDAVGVVHVQSANGHAPPLWLWLVIFGAAIAAVVLAAAWTRPPPARRLGPLAVGGVLLLPAALAAVWSHDELRAGTDRYLATAAAALERLPDLDPVLARPGGVKLLTGLETISSPGGAGSASTLPPETTARLRTAPAGRVSVDHVPYAVRDAGPVRLVMIPYEHTLFRWLPALAAWAVALALSATAANLAPLLPHPARLRRRLTAWSFLGPSFTHLAVFTLGPLAFAAWLSTHRWSLVEEARPFVGLDNYAAVATDGDFWNAVANTAVFTLHVPVAMALALGLALLLHRRGRAAPALRGLLFLPAVTSLVALAVVWQWMFNEEFGLFNWMLSWVGVPPVPWLTSPRTALPALMLMSVWLVIGYQVILFQAGLTAIPRHLYDAARIDGANAWQRFRHVTLPGLRPTLFFVLVTSVIGSFQVFGAVYVMTEGGPLRATDVAVFHIYEEAWQFLRFGRAAAMSWVLFAIIFGVTWLHFRTLERRVETS